MGLHSIFAGAYTLANGSGFLNTGVGRGIFTFAYFQYKKHIEDPFDGFAKRYPHLFHGGHIVDVGANIGYCSTLFSSVLDPTDSCLLSNLNRLTSRCFNA